MPPTGVHADRIVMTRPADHKIPMIERRRKQPSLLQRPEHGANTRFRPTHVPSFHLSSVCSPHPEDQSPLAHTSIVECYHETRVRTAADPFPPHRNVVNLGNLCGIRTIKSLTTVSTLPRILHTPPHTPPQPRQPLLLPPNR